jgi:2-haloacid dehalogenase
MKHRLFLFDLDDTLLDFKASEKLSFARTLQQLGVVEGIDELFPLYQKINVELWRQFETGAVSKDFLKVERFRSTFAANRLDLDAHAASHLYLESLSETVVLIDGATQVCEALAAIGEVGVITNGVASIQSRRIASAGLGDHISFTATSEECGFAKPDIRFFEYTVKMARTFARDETIIIGDRLDADILGANRFGIESCWFNPSNLPNETEALPDYEVDKLDAIGEMLRAATV